MTCMKNKADRTRHEMGTPAMIASILMSLRKTDIRGSMMGWMAICAVNSLSYVWMTWRLQRFVDHLTGGTGSLLWDLLLLSGGLLVGLLFSGLSVWGDEVTEKKLTGVFRRQYHQKVATLDSEQVESPDFVQALNRCEKGIDSAAYIAQSIFFMMSWHVPYFLFLSVYLCMANPSFLFLLLIMVAGTLASQSVKRRVAVSLKQATSDADRRVKYYDSCLFDVQVGKESRVLGIQPLLHQKYQAAVEDYNRAFGTASRKIVAINALSKGIMGLTYVAIFAVLAYNALRGRTSVSVFVAVIASLERMETMVRSMLVSNLGYITENLGGAYFYVDLMRQASEERQEITLESGDAITLDHVTFSYPNGSQPALRDVSLTIEGREKVVIVGKNGSGKTTLTKVLLGLYQPQSGTIRIGDRQMTGRYRIDNGSAVFQDFVRYKAFASDNVCISQPPAALHEERVRFFAPNESQQNRIHRLLTFLRLTSYAQEDVSLGREFGGIDVSGGVWQRIAIARGMYRDSALMVLDEPTSAIDPNEEAEIFDTYDEISKGKTSIIVSHRLGIARMADKIIVMDDGACVGIGPHEELLETCEAYRKLWDAQAQYYV